MLIYLIRCKIDGKGYVGLTESNNFNHRWKKHKENAVYGIESYLYKAIRKYGVSNFTIEILEQCTSIEQLRQREIHFIHELNTHAPNGYNLTLGGDGCNATEIVRQKMSALMTGAGNHRYGKKMSDEQKKKISESLKGRKGRPRTKEENMSHSLAMKGRPSPNKGRPLSEEVKRKISESLKGNASALASQNAAKTHCPKGHGLISDNLIISKNGYNGARRCRTCKNEQERARDRAKRPQTRKYQQS